MLLIPRKKPHLTFNPVFSSPMRQTQGTNSNLQHILFNTAQSLPILMSDRYLSTFEASIHSIPESKYQYRL